MAYSWTANTTPATGSIALFSLISRLITAGWTKVYDSDGTTFSNTGVQVTSGNSGTNGLANTNAWIRMQSPAGAGSTEIVFQRGSNNTLWRIKISMAAGFTGGTPTASKVPSATDEFLFLGTGTDAAPGFGSFFAGADGTYRFSCGADAVAPYTFWSAAWNIGGGSSSSTVTHGFVHDFLTNTAPGDGYTHCFYWAGFSAFAQGTGFVETATSTSPQLAATVAKLAPTGADWFPFTPGVLTNVAGSGGVAPLTLANNPITNKTHNFPMICMRRSGLTSPGYKGILSAMQWTSLPSGENVAGNTQDQVGTKDRIIINQVSLPWNGSQPVI